MIARAPWPRRRARRAATSRRLRPHDRRMARPLFAQINLAALRGEPRAGARARARDAGARRGEGQRLRPRPDARAAGARRRRRARARRARRRDRAARARTTRGGSCCSRASSPRTSCPSSPRGASRRSFTTPSRCAMLEHAHLERPLEVFLKINTRHEPSGRAARGRGGAGRAAHAMRFRRGAAADDAPRARRRGRRDQGAARDVRGRVQGPAVSALDRQLRGRSSASPRSAATSCGRASCCTARRRSLTTRRR